MSAYECLRVLTSAYECLWVLTSAYECLWVLRVRKVCMRPVFVFLRLQEPPVNRYIPASWTKVYISARSCRRYRAKPKSVAPYFSSKLLFSSVIYHLATRRSNLQPFDFLKKNQNLKERVTGCEGIGFLKVRLFMLQSSKTAQMLRNSLTSTPVRPEELI